MVARGRNGGGERRVRGKWISQYICRVRGFDVNRRCREEGEGEYEVGVETGGKTIFIEHACAKQPHENLRNNTVNHRTIEMTLELPSLACFMRHECLFSVYAIVG